MADDVGVDSNGGNVESDYSYDQAHEDLPPAAPAAGQPHPAEPVTVVTETPDTEGDYSYDLAHDIPRAGE